MTLIPDSPRTVRRRHGAARSCVTAAAAAAAITLSGAVSAAPADAALVRDALVRDVMVRDLMVSTTADRATSAPLNGTTLSQDLSVYVTAGSPDRWRSVKFWVDDVTRSGRPLRSDTSAPFDLVGNSSTGAALPLRLSTLRVGSHTVTANIKLSSGLNVVRTAAFTVAAPSGAPVTLSAPPSLAPRPAPAPAPAPIPAPSPVRRVAPAPAPAPSPSPAPAPRNRPSAATTGVVPGTALRPSGSLVVRQAGAVVQNLDINGSLTIQAHDVTVRNVRVRSNSTSYGINVARGFSSTLIENVDVQVGVGGATANAAIGGLGDHGGARGKAHGSNVIVRNSTLTGNGDGIKAANFSLYENNYIRMRRAPGSVKHVDGIQSSGRSYWTARYNWVDQAYSAGHNAAIFAQAYTGKSATPITDINIYRNWVNGGVYTIQTGEGKNGATGLLSNIRINDNVFYRDYLYGAYMPRGGSGVTGNGGTWADTGAAVPSGAVRSRNAV